MIAYVDIVRPSGKTLGFTYDLLCVIGGSLFLAIMSQFAFRLWFTPVPITMQTFCVLLLGGLLGSKRGALSVIAYLGQGVLGLPVFFGGGSGLIVLFGPRGGYLFAFVVAAFLIGYLLERGWRQSYKFTLVAMVLGSTLILGVGAAWLSFFVGLKISLMLGVYPFLVGDTIKTVVAAGLIPSGWKALSVLKKSGF